MKRIMYLTKLIALLIFTVQIALQAQSSKLHLIKKTVIGGEGGWDYLMADSENRKLYVSHATQVEVLDLDTHKKIAVISNTPGVHGIAVAAKHMRGIITNGKNQTATIFDTKTFLAVVDIATGKKPDAVIYDEFSDRALVFNNDGNSTTVVDLKDGKVTNTIDLGGAPEAAVSDGKGVVYVNLEDTNEIVAIDIKTMKLKSRWSIAPGEEPTGLAFDPDTHRLFSVCHNELMLIVDSDNGKIITQLPIGKKVDGVVFDAKSKYVISSNGEGTMTVVQEMSANEFKVIENVKTEPGAKTITYDEKTQHVFTSTAQYGETPVPTTETPKPKPAIVPGTFMILEYGTK